MGYNADNPFNSGFCGALPQKPFFKETCDEKATKQDDKTGADIRPFYDSVFSVGLREQSERGRDKDSFTEIQCVGGKAAYGLHFSQGRGLHACDHGI